jgi:hypothetical protein
VRPSVFLQIAVADPRHVRNVAGWLDGLFAAGSVEGSGEGDGPLEAGEGLFSRFAIARTLLPRPRPESARPLRRCRRPSPDRRPARSLGWPGSCQATLLRCAPAAWLWSSPVDVHPKSALLVGATATLWEPSRWISMPCLSSRRRTGTHHGLLLSIVGSAALSICCSPHKGWLLNQEFRAGATRPSRPAHPIDCPPFFHDRSPHRTG